MAISEEKARIARRMRDLENKSTQQIADEMGVSHQTINRYLREIKVHVPDKDAKILLFDVETAPMEIWAWAIRDQFIQHFQIKEEWFVLSWAAKWLFVDGTMSDCVTPAEALAKDDTRILKGIHDLFEQANIVVAHNAVRFDIRKLNYRFITNGYFKPSPYAVVDTLKQAQRHFAASSHKLDHLTKTFGLSQKHDTTFALWENCVSNKDLMKYVINYLEAPDLKEREICQTILDEEYWDLTVNIEKHLDYMLKYNISDVAALEGLYLFLRPWMTSHPNVAMLMGVVGEACVRCGSKELDWGIKEYPTPSGSFKACRCMDCGAISRSRSSSLSKAERATSLVSPAR